MLTVLFGLFRDITESYTVIADGFVENFYSALFSHHLVE